MERLDEIFTVTGVSAQQCFDYVVNPDHGTAWNGFAKHVEAHPGMFFPVPRFALRRALKHQFDRDIAKLHQHLQELG